MANIIGSPSRYIQGENALQDLGKYAAPFGKRPLVIITTSGIQRVGDTVKASYAAVEDSQVTFEPFQGECSNDEVQRLVQVYRDKGCDLVIGVGGGKILDTAKAVAFYVGSPVVICPTIAATDAPCSALSVLYTPQGVFEKYLFLPSNPNLVLVDTTVIAKAPVRLLVSGMGDALATYFEAKSAIQRGADNCVGGKGTAAALALARLCYDTLLSHGLKAKLAMEAGANSPAVDRIIEANTYLSGIGFESGGLAGAHAVHNGLTVIPECHHLYHGEKVAFGTLVQLVLEDYPMEEMEEVLDFCLSVGLPVCLADLGINNPDPAKLLEAAQLSCAPGDTMGNLTVDVTPTQVRDAMLTADAIGRFFKESC